MNKLLLAICAASLLSACSGSKTADGTQNLASNKDIVCERTAGTGSHLKKKTCMSRAKAEMLREAAKRDMARAQKHINDAARQ